MSRNFLLPFHHKIRISSFTVHGIKFMTAGPKWSRVPGPSYFIKIIEGPLPFTGFSDILLVIPDRSAKRCGCPEGCREAAYQTYNELKKNRPHGSRLSQKLKMSGED
jgi:hypothetical protein